MKLLNRSIAPLAALLGITLLGCTANETRSSYQQSVESVESMLTAKIDKGIFPFTKVVSENRTAFQFIEGSRSNKVDHATPLRVVVTITDLEDGQGSKIEVKAHEHGLKLKKRDKDAEERWNLELSKAIEMQ